MENYPTKIIVHHDGVSRAGASLKIVDDFHRGRGFPLSSLGFYVGYHYWIERDGAVTQTRKDTEEGAHCVGHNLSSIGIGLAGNFDKEVPSTEQAGTLGRLLMRLARTYKIGARNIAPHRRYATKTCYGSRLSNNFAAVLYLQTEARHIADLIAALTDPDNPNN